MTISSISPGQQEQQQQQHRIPVSRLTIDFKQLKIKLAFHRGGERVRDVRKGRDNDQGEGARGDRVMGERGRETSEREETAIRERGRGEIG